MDREDVPHPLGTGKDSSCLRTKQERDGRKTALSTGESKTETASMRAGSLLGSREPHGMYE